MEATAFAAAAIVAPQSTATIVFNWNPHIWIIVMRPWPLPAPRLPATPKLGWRPRM
jgi:hypothetical protein